MTDHHAFAHHIDKLIAARPEHALVRLFLPAGRRDAVSAFEAVVYELEQTLWHAREPQVAVVKLQWWAEELARTLGGEARHPLTQALSAVEPAAALQQLPQQWLATALTLLDDANAGDFAAQRAAAESFYAPLAQIESALLGTGGDAAAPRALSLLLRELGRMAVGQAPHRLAVPLQLLARHQLTREALGQDSEGRERLLHDQLGALARAHEALPAPRDAGLPVRLRLRLEGRLVGRLATKASPAQGLRAAAVGVPLMTAWHAWREARQMR